MTDVYDQEVRGMPRESQKQVAKGEGSTSASGGFHFGISGSSVTGTVTAITVATPFIVLFSPVLFSVFVVVFLLSTGYFTARELGAATKSGFSKVYNYVTDTNKNKNRTREESFDHMSKKPGLNTREIKDRDEIPFEGSRFETGDIDSKTEDETRSYNLVKAATASTTGTSLVAISGITFIVTVIGLILATPPLVLFSPVLVPALITAFLLASGFVLSGGFGVAAATMLAYTYRLYVHANEGRPMMTSRIFGSKPQESRYEETDMLSETRDYETTQNRGGNYEVVKAATVTTVGGSLLVLSGLTFIGTVIGLTMATPLMVIFSPVLIPAIITVFLLTSGLFASSGFSVAAVTTLGWLYKYVTKEQQTESNLFDREPQGLTTEKSEPQGLTSEKRGFIRDIDAFEEGKIDEKTHEIRDFNREVDVGEEGKLGFQYPYKTESETGYNTGYNGVVKAASATTAGGSLLVISGLTFIGTVIALTMATPLLVLFSPVLVPALITLSLLALGFIASGGFGVTGTMVLAWLYKYVSSGQQSGQQRTKGEGYTTNTLDLKGRERTYMSDQAIRASHRETDLTDSGRVSPASHHKV